MARLPRLVQMGHGARGLRTNCVAEAECFGPIRFVNVVFAQRAYAPMNMCMGMHLGCTVVRAVSRCQQSCQNLVWWPAATLIPDLFDTTYVLTSCVLACDDSAGWWVSMYSGVLIKKMYGGVDTCLMSGIRYWDVWIMSSIESDQVNDNKLNKTRRLAHALLRDFLKSKYVTWLACYFIVSDLVKNR
jgi:hypothetical protein